MGTYIMIGQCYKFNVDITNLDDEKIDIVRKNAAEFIDTDAYNCIVKGNVMSFQAKPELFLDGHVDLVKRQLDIWDEKDNDTDEIIERISSAKTIEELLEITESKRYYNYSQIDDYSYVECDWRNTRRATVHMIYFSMIGKAFIECFFSFFNGIEKLIKLDCPVPASRFMKVILTS